jgi:hypothetical protein
MDNRRLWRTDSGDRLHNRHILRKRGRRFGFVLTAHGGCGTVREVPEGGFGLFVAVLAGHRWQAGIPVGCWFPIQTACPDLWESWNRRAVPSTVSNRQAGPSPASMRPVRKTEKDLNPVADQRTAPITVILGLCVSP